MFISCKFRCAMHSTIPRQQTCNIYTDISIHAMLEVIRTSAILADVFSQKLVCF